MRFLAMLDDAIQERAKGLIVLFARGNIRLHMLHLKEKFMPSLLNLFR